MAAQDAPPPQLLAPSPAGSTEPDVPTWDSVFLGVSNGDFARLVPRSPAAQALFSQVAQLLEKEPNNHAHARRFIHYECTDNAGSTTDTSAESGPESTLPQASSAQEYCGYYRLNMQIPPANLGLGWVLGASRRDKPAQYVDFLLAPFTSQRDLHSRHFRLRRLLQTGVLLAVSDSRKVYVNHLTLQRDSKKAAQDASAYQTALAHPSTIRIGNLTYLLVFTDLHDAQQKQELEDALTRYHPNTHSSVQLLSPTPSKSMIDYHGYQIFDPQRHGTTSNVAIGYAPSGEPVAVKMVKCSRQLFYNLKQEIAILRLLNHGNVCKLRDVSNWDPEADPNTWTLDQGPMVGLIFSPPASTSGTQLLLSWTFFPDPAQFLRDTISQTASGLAYIHSLSILHRDIKPDNIVYTSVSPVHAVIIDFGASESAMHSTDHMRGTIPYLAPEVIRLKEGQSGNAEPFSFASDVWSLGVTMHDILSGSKSKQAWGYEEKYKSLEHVFSAKIAGQEYRAFWDITWRLLAWDPDARPIAEEVARESLELIPMQDETRDFEEPSKHRKL